MAREIKTPLEDARLLRCGEQLLLTGVVYTARDAAHARLAKLLEEGRELPFPIQGSVIYYVGPTPAPPGRVIGSAGPTTSYRMDIYTPALLKAGLRGMIGKGVRDTQVIEAIKATGSVYFGALGGAGALHSQCVKSAEVVAYEDLGTEAIRRLEVERLPVMVAIDSTGENLYQRGRQDYLKQRG